jgi:hypothetical protein
LSFLPDLLIGVLVFVVVAVVIAAVSLMAGGWGGSSGYVGITRSLFWSHLVNPSLNVFGWMSIYLGSGWTAFSLYRHFFADRAVVSLSPAGIRFHRPWLNGLFIPWQEVRGVGHQEAVGSAGLPFTTPNAAVVVGQDFYERHIAPKRSFFAPPGSEAMFWPKGEMMQVVLNSADMTVKPEDFLGPVEARWKAFRDRSEASSQHDGSGTSIVYGRWSINGSAWQIVWFLAPLIGMAVVMLYR